MNGNVEIIDDRFDLYRFRVAFSSCTRFSRYEGASMTSLATRAHALPTGAFHVLLTGVVAGRLELQSPLFVPI